MTADTPATETPIRDAVDRIWDMRAELWSDGDYDGLDVVVTDVYAAGVAAGRAEEREACAQLAEEVGAADEYDRATARWLADLIRARSQP